MLKNKLIPICEPILIGNEVRYVLDCLNNVWISSSGNYLERFEQGMANLCQVKFGIACANGTVALHLACVAAGLGPGDEVIMPAFTIISTANAVVQTGATPVLVDVEPETLCLDPEQMLTKIGPRTKVIIVVHMYGQPADMDLILKIADDHKLIVIEDAAQVHGAKYKRRSLGGLGKMGTFSFYANKLITTGEGGMVVTDDIIIADKLRLLRNLAHSDSRRFSHQFFGYNYRLTNLQAAIGLAQLEKLEVIKVRKADIGDRYSTNLKNIEDLTLYWNYKKDDNESVMWMYGLLLPERLDRDIFMKQLWQKGIDSRPFFLPINEQPLYDGSQFYFPDLRGEYPVSQEAGRRGIYLPSGVGITNEQIDKICEVIRELLF